MSGSVEEKLKDAFDAVTMPPGLKEDTLRAIESKRSQQTKSVQPASRLKRKSSAFKKTVVALAACFILGVCSLGGFKAYTTETALVGIELNPSIELGINRFNIVIDVRAGNGDGALVLESVSVVGKSFDQAILLITTDEVFLSYVDDTSFVDISVVSKDDRQSAALVSEGEAGIENLPCPGACGKVSAETRQEALSAGMGVGRYEVAQELMALDPRMTLEDCQSMRMKDLRKRIADIDPDNTFAWQAGHGNNHRGT